MFNQLVHDGFINDNKQHKRCQMDELTSLTTEGAEGLMPSWRPLLPEALNFHGLINICMAYGGPRYASNHVNVCIWGIFMCIYIYILTFLISFNYMIQIMSLF